MKGDPGGCPEIMAYMVYVSWFSPVKEIHSIDKFNLVQIVAQFYKNNEQLTSDR